MNAQHLHTQAGSFEIRPDTELFSDAGWMGSPCYFWKRANAGNDEVLTHQQTTAQVHRAYCKECREKYQKAKSKEVSHATNDNDS